MKEDTRCTCKHRSNKKRKVENAMMRKVFFGKLANLVHRSHGLCQLSTLIFIVFPLLKTHLFLAMCHLFREEVEMNDQETIARNDRRLVQGKL